MCLADGTVTAPSSARQGTRPYRCSSSLVVTDAGPPDLLTLTTKELVEV